MMLDRAPGMEIHLLLRFSLRGSEIRIPLSAPIKSGINQHLKPAKQIPGRKQRGVFAHNTSFTLYRSRETSASELPG